jgi:hypothetical protein
LGVGVGWEAKTSGHTPTRGTPGVEGRGGAGSEAARRVAQAPEPAGARPRPVPAPEPEDPRRPATGLAAMCGSGTGPSRAGGGGPAPLRVVALDLSQPLRPRLQR